MATPVQSSGNTVNSIAALAVMEMGSRPFDSSDHQVSSSTPPNMLPPAYTSVVMEMQDNASDSSASSDGVSDRLSGIGECDRYSGHNPLFSKRNLNQFDFFSVRKPPHQAQCHQKAVNPAAS